MLCGDCQARGRHVRPRPRLMARRDRAVERLRALACAACSRLLPAPDSTDRLLSTLSGLSRFGLAGEGRVIVAHRAAGA
jgi:hypothetical protein